MLTATSMKPINKGGRPRKVDPEQVATDQGLCYEKVTRNWSELAYSLSQDVLQQVRAQVKSKVFDKSLNSRLIAAGIAYDKAFAKRDAGEVTVSIPGSLSGSLSLALSVKSPDNKHYVNCQDLTPDSVTVSAPESVLDLQPIQANDIDHEPIQAQVTHPTPPTPPGVGLRCPDLAGAGAGSDPVSAPVPVPNFLQAPKSVSEAAPEPAPEPVPVPLPDPAQFTACPVCEIQGYSYTHSRACTALYTKQMTSPGGRQGSKTIARPGAKSPK